jgi:hypothetical protein
MECKINPADILLFEECQKTEAFQTPNHLRGNLRFIKWARLHPLPEVAFIPRTDNLIPGMSLKENIVHQKQDRFNFFEKIDLDDILNATANPYLKKLAKQIKDFELPTSECEPTQRKLASIVKGILNPAAIMSVVGPADHLNHSQFTDYINALVYEVQKHSRILFLNQVNQTDWDPYIKKIVSTDTLGQYLIRQYQSDKSHLELIQSLEPLNPLKKSVA